MAELSRLVEGLRITNSPSKGRYRRRPEYRDPLEAVQSFGAQGTTPQGWKGDSDIQNLHLKVLDPTSQDIPYPPFDLDSRLVESFQSPGTVPEQLLKSLGFLPNEPSSKLIADHDQPQTPAPEQAIQEDDESESWITTSLESTQDLCEHSVAPVLARRRGFNDRRIRHAFAHSLLGSSIADISDNSSVPSFNTNGTYIRAFCNKTVPRGRRS